MGSESTPDETTSGDPEIAVTPEPAAEPDPEAPTLEPNGDDDGADDDGTSDDNEDSATE